MKKVSTVLLSTLVLPGMLSTAFAFDKLELERGDLDNNAKIYAKGQQAYGKMCKACHGNGVKGAAMKADSEWDELFNNSAAGLKAAHGGVTPDGRQKSAWKAMNGKYMEKRGAYLLEFLWQYAKGKNPPAC